jgi:hypothetical protein
MATLDIDGRQATLAWESPSEGPSDSTLRWRTIHRTRLT